MTAASDDPAEHVRLRPHWQLPLPHLVFLVLWSSSLAQTRASHPAASWFPETVVTLLLLLTLTEVVLTLARHRVVLTPEGVTVTRWGRRLIPWDRVTSLAEPEPRRRSGRRLGLRLADGTVLYLPAPNDGRYFPDRRFAERAAIVRDFFQRYGPAPTGRPVTVYPAVQVTEVGMSPVRRWWPVPVSGLVVLVPCVATGHHGVVTAVLTFFAAAVGAGLFADTRGVLVTPGGLRFRRRGRRRDVLWTYVGDLAVEEAGPRRRVVLTLTDGTRLPLPTPRTGRVIKDAGFDERAATLTRWWAACGGPRP